MPTAILFTDAEQCMCAGIVTYEYDNIIMVSIISSNNKISYRPRDGILNALCRAAVYFM